jgi:predicted CoA-substrate-specific enzyme activase
MSAVYLGCDVGSLVTKAVAVDRGGRPLARRIVPTTGTMADLLPDLLRQTLGDAGAQRAAGLGATGRGRKLVPGDDDCIEEDELACTGWAVHRLLPGVSEVLDIGGQSITALRLDDDGELADLGRHDKCASGSGRFLELMAEALDMDLEQLDRAAGRAARAAPISTQCGVFVESEVVTHLNAGVEPDQIAAGLCDAVARIVVAQARRYDLGGGRYTITGGVARLRAVTAALERHLPGQHRPFPADPRLAAALGAALMAADED